MLALFLALGGLDALWWLGARWRTMMQPPPAAASIDGPVPDAEPLRAALPAERVRGRMWLAEPPRPFTVALVLAGIMTATVLAMFVTGRDTGPRA